MRDCAEAAQNHLQDLLTQPVFFYHAMVLIEQEFLTIWPEGYYIRSAKRCPVGFAPLVRPGHIGRDGIRNTAFRNHGPVTSGSAVPKVGVIFIRPKDIDDVWRNGLKAPATREVLEKGHITPKMANKLYFRVLIADSSRFASGTTVPLGTHPDAHVAVYYSLEGLVRE